MGAYLVRWIVLRSHSWCPSECGADASAEGACELFQGPGRCEERDHVHEESHPPRRVRDLELARQSAQCLRALALTGRRRSPALAEQPGCPVRVEVEELAVPDRVGQRPWEG